MAVMTSSGLEKSPSATLKGHSGGTRASISASVAGDTAPSEPRPGSFASMMSAPPLSAGPTSAPARTLTSNCMEPLPCKMLRP